MKFSGFKPKSEGIKTNSGFTLTELIITVVMIGLLAAIISQGMGQYLKRARDQARKSELSQIQQALTLYYNDFQAYPCADDPYFVGSLPGCGLTASYMAEIPHDERAPLNDCNAQFSDYAYIVLNTGQDFQLYSRLETVSALPYNVTIGITSCDYNYKVENP